MAKLFKTWHQERRHFSLEENQIKALLNQGKRWSEIAVLLGRTTNELKKILGTNEWRVWKVLLAPWHHPQHHMSRTWSTHSPEPPIIYDEHFLDYDFGDIDFSGLLDLLSWCKLLNYLDKCIRWCYFIIEILNYLWYVS